MDEQGQRGSELGQLLDSEGLRDWMSRQRWYASKAKSLNAVELIEVAPLNGSVHLALVQTRVATGAHEIYQLLLLVRDVSDGEGVPEHALSGNGEEAVYAALEQPRNALALIENILGDVDIRTHDGCFAFRHLAGAHVPGPDPLVRAMGAQQSNSSLVIDERVALKLFRKLESGINPELEMLRFLTERGFDRIAPLEGWYEYEGSSLASTLGIAQTFIPDGCDGWELAQGEIATAPDDFVARLGDLGRVTAQMHNTLASDATDPAFSPEEPISESMSLLAAAIDEDIERIFMRLPDNDAITPIRGRGEDVRAKLAERANLSAGGKHIRIHGDYHLGQTLHAARGWVILDFEGEPGRPLPERRQKRSPLRDVAGMLRSLAYASSALGMHEHGSASDRFEQLSRETFLGAYLDEIDSALLPAGDGAIANLLEIFELEKAVYELRYEMNNRPDWVRIPVAGIVRLLEEA